MNINIKGIFGNGINVGVLCEFVDQVVVKFVVGIVMFGVVIIWEGGIWMCV